MGMGQSKKYISESEISDDDSEEKDNNLMDQEKGKHKQNGGLYDPLDNMLDAVIRPSLPNSEQIISLEKLESIEDQLDEFELVSLLYLLYDHSGIALQALQSVLKSGRREGLLLEWAQHEKLEGKVWQKKLVEALCIVQNYQVLKNFGYNKPDLLSTYMPYQAEATYAVKKIRKICYLIAEKLTKQQTSQFLRNMKMKLTRNNIDLPNFNEDYVELYFLYWEYTNVNIKDIQMVFKSMELEVFYDQLSSFVPPKERSANSETNSYYSFKSAGDQSKSKYSEGSKPTPTRDNTYIIQPGSFEDNLYLGYQPGTSGISQESSLLDTNGYSIDSDNPGVVLIINQEAFYTEPDKRYKHLLHKNKDVIQLQERLGTTVDKNRLKNLFSRMKFKVTVLENLAHFHMVERIEQVTDSVPENSSLTVCILSHGDSGVVYGANSCKVDVYKIQSIMCKRNKRLIGQPKVLILQSCQGERCQKIEEGEDTEDDNEDNATDGPTNVPATADLLTFWATIPGYAAIRDKKKGSWFIQAICDEIEQVGSKYHLLDICTRAVNKVTRRKWKEERGVNVMTPMVVSTLTKSFFLPPVL